MVKGLTQRPISCGFESLQAKMYVLMTSNSFLLTGNGTNSHDMSFSFIESISDFMDLCHVSASSVVVASS